MLKILFSNSEYAKPADIALLFLRVGVGLTMMLGHGWGKLTGFGERAAGFSDPIGLGSTLSMAMAVFAEFFCSLGLILGVFTRFSVIPLMSTMLVAFFIVHSEDPFRRKELALVYLIPFITIFFTGAGKYSIDYYINKWFGK